MIISLGEKFLLFNIIQNNLNQWISLKNILSNMNFYTTDKFNTVVGLTLNKKIDQYNYWY